jgi:hypothetical protein
MAVLLQAKDLRVRSLDLDFHELSWKLEDTSEDVLDYSFQVLRSESASGPFDALAPPFLDRFIFVDNALQVAHRWRQYYYLLRIEHLQSGQKKDFGPVAKEPDPDLLAMELRRHMMLLFREFAGRRCWVLPVRTFGQRCPSCWNATLQQRRKSGCIDCYGTGFARGFLSPIETWMQFDPSPKSEQTTNTGPMQQSNTTARISYFPALKPRDVIVEGENRRWRVVQVSQTEQVRAAVHQELQLHEIPPKDIEFAIPLKMDEALRDLWLSPQRNFSNPNNLEAFDRDEIPRIFSLYNRRKVARAAQALAVVLTLNVVATAPAATCLATMGASVPAEPILSIAATTPVPTCAVSMSAVLPIALTITATTPAPTCLASIAERLTLSVAATTPVATCVAPLVERATFAVSATAPIATCAASLTETATFTVAAAAPAATCLASLAEGLSFAVAATTPVATCAVSAAEIFTCAIAGAVPVATCAVVVLTTTSDPPNLLIVATTPAATCAAVMGATGLLYIAATTPVATLDAALSLDFPFAVAATARVATCAASLGAIDLAVAATAPVATSEASVLETFTCSVAATTPVATSTVSVLEEFTCAVAATTQVATCAAVMSAAHFQVVATTPVATSSVALSEDFLLSVAATTPVPTCSDTWEEIFILDVGATTPVATCVAALGATNLAVSATTPVATSAATVTETFSSTIAATAPVATCVAAMTLAESFTITATTPVATASSTLVETFATTIAATTPVGTCVAAMNQTQSPAAAGANYWVEADSGVASSAGLVSQWDDKTASAWNVVEATGANKPTILTNTLNGLPVIQFTRTSSTKLVLTSTQVWTTTFTMGVVIRGLTSASGTARCFGLAVGDIGGIALVIDANDKWRAQYEGAGGYVNNANQGAVDGAYHIITMKSASPTSVVTMRIDGTDQTPAGAGTTWSVPTFANTGHNPTLEFGVNHSSTTSYINFSGCYIAAAFMCNTALSDPVLHQVEQWWANKYALTIA